MNKSIETVIWDWNGTLINDLDICVEGINKLLKRRSLPVIDESRYKEIFTFPVKAYYEAAGFDFSKEPFEIPAEEFITEYQHLSSRVMLFHDAELVLSYLKQIGIKQFVLSAMKQDALLKSLENHNIRNYFEGVYGIEDNFAVSKIKRGRDLIEDHQINREKSLLIGDTLHDMEVSKDLGIDMVIIGRGHQHRSRLMGKGYPVLNDLTELKKHLVKAL